MDDSPFADEPYAAASGPPSFDQEASPNQQLPGSVAQPVANNTPKPIRLLLVANDLTLSPADPELQQAAARADLVISLGGVNLDALKQVMMPQTQGIALLGPRDPVQVPEPFKVVHGSGFTFRQWKIAGISGGQRAGEQSGMYLSDSESISILDALDPCDIFLSHSYPAALDGVNKSLAMPSLDEYIRSKVPSIHFYAHPSEIVVGGDDDTLSVGVCGYFQPDAIEYI